MTGRVHVVGSANVDRTIPISDAPGPGETVLGGSVVRGPGGKGLNQAVAAARMGADTAFVGAVGEDVDGDLLRAALEREGIDTRGVARVTDPTGLAVILLEPDGSNRIVVAPGANHRVTADELAVRLGDLVVAQLEIPLDVVAAALTVARAAGARTVLNAAPARRDLDAVLGTVDVLVVNQPELAALAPEAGGGGDIEAIARSARRLPTRTGVVVTLGARGAVIVTSEEHWHLRVPPVAVVDTTGAGDCFVGALAARLAAGDGLRAAGAVAVRAGALSVTAAGAAPSMPTTAALAAWDPVPGSGGPI